MKGDVSLFLGEKMVGFVLEKLGSYERGVLRQHHCQRKWKVCLRRYRLGELEDSFASFVKRPQLK